MRFADLVTSDRITRLVAGRPLSVLFTALFLLMGVSSLFGQQADREEREAPFRLIGATATVTEASSGLPFNARVDTGATTCSIHCEAMEIEGASENAKENIGKSIRFLVKNKKGEAEWLTAVVADYAIVRTSERADWRYKVKLRLRWQDIEKKVLGSVSKLIFEVF